MNNYFKHIGETFTVKGFNEPRTVRIKSFYYLAGKLKYPAYECEVIGDYKFAKNGDRENFLCADILQGNELKNEIKVLSA